MTWRGATELVVFGRRSVLEALGSPAVETLRVRCDERAPASFLKELKQACRERSVEPEFTPIGAVSEVSGAPRHDQGVAAKIRLTNIAEPEVFAQGLTGKRAAQPTRLIALDAVTNPQNIGMIVRSAVASGMSGILWPTVGSPWIDGLTIKSSASAIYRATVIRCGLLQDGLWTLKKFGFRVVGLAGESGAPLAGHTPPHRAAYVVGSETAGITPSVAEAVDEFVSIPMRNGVESLNVAVAAALVCFAAAPPPAP